jgi:hypothetical protein
MIGDFIGNQNGGCETIDVIPPSLRNMNFGCKESLMTYAATLSLLFSEKQYGPGAPKEETFPISRFPDLIWGADHARHAGPRGLTESFRTIRGVIGQRPVRLPQNFPLSRDAILFTTEMSPSKQ